MRTSGPQVRSLHGLLFFSARTANGRLLGSCPRCRQGRQRRLQSHSFRLTTLSSVNLAKATEFSRTFISFGILCLSAASPDSSWHPDCVIERSNATRTGYPGGYHDAPRRIRDLHTNLFGHGFLDLVYLEVTLQNFRRPRGCRGRGTEARRTESRPGREAWREHRIGAIEPTTRREPWRR